jgi:hypothetical protein
MKKMPVYRVEITRFEYGYVDIEANSGDAALKRVDIELKNGNFKCTEKEHDVTACDLLPN